MQLAFASNVVEIARSLFFEEGFDSVSMRRIAQRAGCSPMAIYHYFPNKHAILRHIWIAIFDTIDAKIELVSRDSPDSLTELRTMAKAYLAYWSANPDHFHIVYLTTDPGSIALGDSVLNADGSSVKTLYDRFDNVLTRCVAERLLFGATPAMMGQLLFSSMYGMLLCTLTVPEFRWAPSDQLADELIEHFIRGYAAAG